MMRPMLWASVVALSLAWLTGCENQPAPGGKPGSAAPQSTVPGPASPTATQPDAGSSATPAAAKAMTVKLSTGVALPQTAPDGTMMSFSVDYEFIQGQPEASEYSLVIDRAAGPPAREAVRLGRKGTLAVLLPGWTPEEAPFVSHLEDQNGHPVSAPLKMR